MAKGENLNIHKGKRPSVLKATRRSIQDIVPKSRKKLPNVEDIVPKKPSKKLPSIMDII